MTDPTNPQFAYVVWRVEAQPAGSDHPRTMEMFSRTIDGGWTWEPPDPCRLRPRQRCVAHLAAGSGEEGVTLSKLRRGFLPRDQSRLARQDFAVALSWHPSPLRLDRH